LRRSFDIGFGRPSTGGFAKTAWLGFKLTGCLLWFRWTAVQPWMRGSLAGKGKPRDLPAGVQEGQSARLGGAHAFLVCRQKVIVAGEVEPAVHDVEGQLLRKITAMLFREGAGGVSRDADFSRLPRLGRGAGKGDDVGRRRIAEERGMQARQGGVGEKGEGEFARRNAPSGRGAKDFVGMRVEQMDDCNDSMTIETEPRMAVVDADRTLRGYWIPDT
jgi:hypothetical protein